MSSRFRSHVELTVVKYDEHGVAHPFYRAEHCWDSLDRQGVLTIQGLLKDCLDELYVAGCQHPEVVPIEALYPVDVAPTPKPVPRKKK